MQTSLIELNLACDDVIFCFPLDKELPDGEKMTSSQARFVIDGEICGQSFMFIKTVYSCERFVSFVHLLSECF